MNDKQAYYICLGTFDGVHAGHQTLLRKTAEWAGSPSRAMAFTFDRNPAELFGREVAYLSTNAQREAWMRGCGVGTVTMVEFDRAFASLSPEDFIGYLLKRWEVLGLVAGFNYTFGAGGRGTAETLVSLGARYGFPVTVMQPVLYKGCTVSSSRIRECLSAGNLADANAMLTRPYTLTGTVVKNRGIGTGIGFPTANLLPGKQALPPDGVYASRAVFDAGSFPAVTNVGTNPTVNGAFRTVETHVLEGSPQLNGKTLSVELIDFLRPEHRFDSLEELKTQIGADCRRAREILNM